MLERFTRRRNFPYLHGVYLATNVIRDAYLVVDGPNCAFFKTEHVFGAHDLRSTLLDVTGRHRILHTELNPDRVIGGHDAEFRRVVGRLLAEAEPGAVLVGSLPMASLTGIDYEGLVDGLDARGVPVVVLPSRSLDRDWIDGYADTLRRIAESIALDPGPVDPGKVAIVGHFMDRNEGDGLGNVAELRRIVRGVGLDPVSIWLDGGAWADLARAGSAGIVVSLPHGRAAASVLAERTGATLVEADLPFGTAASDRLVMALGTAASRADEAAAFRDVSREEVGRAWEWLVPRRLLFRNLAFVGDPLMMPGFCEMADRIGCRVTALLAYGRCKPDVAPGTPGAAVLHCEPVFQPRQGDGVPDALRSVDLLVSNSWFTQECGAGESKLVELGFPSRGYHCGFEAPYLGYRGALCLVDRISNALGDRAVYV